jgi:Trypsin
LRRISALLALVFAVLAIAATPAGAITGNYNDDFVHPYVGLIAFYDEDDVFTHRCSGSLLTPIVFLTAGHCTEPTTGATHARLWFQQDAGVGFDPVTETPAPSGYPVASDVTSSHLYDFGFRDVLPNTHDVGLVILDKPIAVGDEGFAGGFASIASVGSLDRLATRRGLQAVAFTASGYGLSYSSPVASVSFRKRLMATENLINLRSFLTDGFNIQLTANRGNGKGGTCGGDSGGPLLYDATNTIVAVNSFGLNEWCRGTDFMYRVDRADVQAWIRAIVGDAQWRLISVVSF